MKLTAAKCPSCGAAIEVNKKLEKAICQFCGTTVFVEEAIEKLKIELSGKVEVDGIETRKSKLDRARKHIKLKEYRDANIILSGLIAENKLDEDAYLELLKMKLFASEDDGFDGKSSRSSAPSSWKVIEEALDIVDRINKIDDDHSLDSEMEELKPLIDKYEKMLDDLNKSEKNLAESKKKLKNILMMKNEWSSDSSEDRNKICDIVTKVFKLNRKISTTSAVKESNAYEFDDYVFDDIEDFGSDGTITISYRKVTNKSVFNPYDDTKTYRSTIEPMNEEVMKSLTDKCYEEVSNYFEKVEKKGKASNSFKKVLFALSALGCIGLVLFTLILFIGGEWLSGILLVFLVDSWLAPILFNAAMYLYSELK